MKYVLEHPLGPIPWSLASSDGSIRKTNKAALGKELEKSSSPAEIIPEDSACIIDAMSVIQKVKGNHNTFSDLADTVFKMVMAEGFHYKRIDMVFDVYRDMSIKNTDRKEYRGASEAIHFKNISSGHKFQQWKKFLSGQSNKKSLILFICNEWKTTKYRQRLNGKILYLAYEDECFKLTDSST